MKYHTERGECTSNCRRKGCPEELSSIEENEVMREMECWLIDIHLKKCDKHKI